LLSTAVTAIALNTSLSSTNAATYRTSSAAGLAETNAAVAEVRALEQMIASQKSAIAQAQAQLDLTSASSTGNDIAVAQAGVAQAQANVAEIEAQIKDLEIVAPSDGIVTATNGTVGEVVTPDIPVVSIMPQGVLQVKVNVSEDNIVGVALGQTARIELDAFPSGTEFAGTVSEIDPAQTVIGGAIYYQTTLLFDQNYPGIKPGMTANVWIDTGYATSTLIVPASAITQNGASSSVQLYQNGSVTTRAVTTGLKDQNGMVEITSGLAQGDRVVTGGN
jgi:RND family efflux transporter MFP subunit